VVERLPVLMHALEDERVADGFGASPRPVQTPRPPIWVAGSTPPAIRRAAKFGDGWLPQGPSDQAMVDLLRQGLEKYGRVDADLMIGHIAPFMYVGDPGWDVGEGVLTGSAQSIAEQTLAGTTEGVNQIQVRFKARSCDELCDQIAAFATDVAPLLQP
jgi:alkanesulfonate monooxygenase SsuD/methylene tetrahydromethanopterin reductase-like flavin-dependent oxidoreductase (luciferase family)